MIRLAEDLYATERGRKTVEPPATNGWHGLQQGLQQWVRTRPEVALILAAGVGAVLALAIKRRL